MRFQDLLNRAAKDGDKDTIDENTPKTGILGARSDELNAQLNGRKTVTGFQLLTASNPNGKTGNWPF